MAKLKKIFYTIGQKPTNLWIKLFFKCIVIIKKLWIPVINFYNFKDYLENSSQKPQVI